MDAPRRAGPGPDPSGSRAAGLSAYPPGRFPGRDGVRGLYRLGYRARRDAQRANPPMALPAACPARTDCPMAPRAVAARQLTGQPLILQGIGGARKHGRTILHWPASGCRLWAKFWRARGTRPPVVRPVSIPDRFLFLDSVSERRLLCLPDSWELGHGLALVDSVDPLGDCGGRSRRLADGAKSGG
jgi:hypothetical protein